MTVWRIYDERGAFARSYDLGLVRRCLMTFKLQKHRALAVIEGGRK